MSDGTDGNGHGNENENAIVGVIVNGEALSGEA